MEGREGEKEEKNPTKMGKKWEKDVPFSNSQHMKRFPTLCCFKKIEKSFHKGLLTPFVV